MNIFIFWLKAVTWLRPLRRASVSRPASTSAIICLKQLQEPRPRVTLRSFFMASITGPQLDGGIALPCSARHKTLRRRLQRKHTEQSYRQLKAKLLSLLKPLPTAAYCADLEDFRQTLYATNDDAMSSRGPDSNTCLWCGIWMPLPKMPITIITTEVKESSTSADCGTEPDPIICQLVKVVDAVDVLLEHCLCQAPSYIGQGTSKSDKGRSLWTHRGSESIFAADASSSRGDEPICASKRDYNYDFKRTRALFDAEVPEALPRVSSSPVPSQYSTDESTGECKSQ